MGPHTRINLEKLDRKAAAKAQGAIRSFRNLILQTIVDVQNSIPKTSKSYKALTKMDNAMIEALYCNALDTFECRGAGTLQFVTENGEEAKDET